MKPASFGVRPRGFTYLILNALRGHELQKDTEFTRAIAAQNFLEMLSLVVLQICLKLVL
jgi:hypothetical protein